ncbi:MAG: bifunctional diaminohydroxyphosphoribosylaminopyrimidine deaminase/5-amino-6-(5-phosphoribosylamino)uracil reductase RibD [Planctomycetes bacterium]|nr:bifunctional diaminohydroxyphosphoribosylaminopyrimidine deaminase/5-amino-6-(5-phosphoribosylamino)uracil reductase RibD [Planctomycetota bacterium]
MNVQDEQFMRSALKLAARGVGSVEPNPAVGCLIVKAGQRIGQGYHKKFGGPHAEINALADCRTLGLTPQGATLYVTLEPCCHVGKTGPCTDAVIQAGIARVVAATLDPSAHANGRGLEQLRQAGIAAEVGLCEQEAQHLNAPFFKYVTTGQPWVILKWAQSIDGKLAYAQPSSESRWITNADSRSDAHRLRRRAGAVLVGINTVLADDPLLTPRPSRGHKPIRVVLDGSLRTPLTCRLLRTARTSSVLIYTRQASIDANPQHADQVRRKGAELLACESAGNPQEDTSNLDLSFLLAHLGRCGVQQVLVEGGPRVAASFLRTGQADEVCVYIAPKILGAVGTAGLDEPMASLGSLLALRQVEIKTFGEDVRLSGRLPRETAAP